MPPRIIFQHSKTEISANGLFVDISLRLENVDGSYLADLPLTLGAGDFSDAPKTINYIRQKVWQWWMQRVIVAAQASTRADQTMALSSALDGYVIA